MAKRFDITAFGELLIDFTNQGNDENGTKLFAQNPGGAPANVAVAVARLGLDELVTATRFANAVAVVCITKQGAIPAMPTVLEMDKLSYNFNANNLT